LSSSEAALRTAIQSARSTLQLADDGKSTTQSAIPSPPVSTRTAVSCGSGVTSNFDDPASPPMSFRSEHDQTLAMMSTSLHDSSQAASGHLEEDFHGLAYRDEVTGLTLELPFGQDFDMFNFRGDNFRK
jgi:hypothetical protein